jgi:hypothetical protein
VGADVNPMNVEDFAAFVKRQVRDRHQGDGHKAGVIDADVFFALCFGGDDRPVPDHTVALTSTLLPARTVRSFFTSPRACANTLQGLASRVSSPRLIGVRPKPIAMQHPSGQ